MNRLHFLRSAFALVTSTVFAPGIAAKLTAQTTAHRNPQQAAARDTQAVRQLPLFQTYVAGVQHHAWYHQGMVETIDVGTKLSIQREPTNTEDSRAIALYTNNDTMVGYVPRWLNCIPSNLLDYGETLLCTVTKFNGHDTAAPWHLIKCEIALTTPSGKHCA